MQKNEYAIILNVASSELLDKGELHRVWLRMSDEAVWKMSIKAGLSEKWVPYNCGPVFYSLDKM